MKLTENTILITGGSSGIGLAIAKEFAKRGNTCIVCGRNEKGLEQVAKDFPVIKTIKCDIRSQNDREYLVEIIREKYPNLNILVNNAGIQHNYSFLDESNHQEEIEEEIEINLTSQIVLTALLLPMLKSHREAAIVNITSALALVPKESAPVYCATKAALSSFSKALRYQLESSTVKVFEVIPALVKTKMTEGRGKNKITPESLAEEAIREIGKDNFEIRIEKAKLLYCINRLSPRLAMKIMQKK